MGRRSQWQIEALWRFQIPEDLRRKYRILGLTERAKRKILGLTSAKLYKHPRPDAWSKPVPKDYESRMSPQLKTLLEFGQLKADNMSRMKGAPLPGDRTGPYPLRMDPGDGLTDCVA